MDKTAATVLQELMTKLQDMPSYECISQTGPQHQMVFEYRCTARGVTAHGVARSKKEAKQEAARNALAALAARGLPVPPRYRCAPPPAPRPADRPAPSNAPQLPSSSQEAGAAEGGGGAVLDARSYVALLKELCEEYRLGAPEFELVSDTGPPHQRLFTVRARVGRHERVATATTKKAARQLAAEQLYTYLRGHLATATKDFVEKCEPEVRPERSGRPGAGLAAPDSPRKRKAPESAEESEHDGPSKRPCDGDTRAPAPPLEPEPEPEPEPAAGASEEALSRALDKAMSRYVEVREELPWRPDLGQRVADYHLGLFTRLTEEQRLLAEREAARAPAEEPEAALTALAAALGLRVELSQLPADGGLVSVVSLGPAAPALTLAGRDPAAACAAALRYLRRALASRPDPAPAAAARRPYETAGPQEVDSC